MKTKSRAFIHELTAQPFSSLSILSLLHKDINVLLFQHANKISRYAERRLGKLGNLLAGDLAHTKVPATV